MHIKERQNIQDFWVIGINYKKTDAAVRGLFAVSNESYAQLLSAAPQCGIGDFFILSTCNRTEIYGFADNAGQLGSLLCSAGTGDAAVFESIAYSKSGYDAMEHLYHVAAGLDSQILGDYEILGQLKGAVKFAKIHGFTGVLMERLINSVLQASKAVKTNTLLSGGTVSVSFTAVQYIRQHWEGLSVLPGMAMADKKIVLVGTGKIGKATCRNLVDYLHTHNITLINRTEETAANLAKQLGLSSVPFESLDSELRNADVILVSTNAAIPVIAKEHLEGRGDKLVIDLSVPCNVATDAQKLPGVTFVDVDTLSKIKDETLQNRKEEVPKAIAIIQEHIAEFKDWCDMRRHVPVLKEVKNKLKGIYIDPVLLKNNALICAGQPELHEEKIQKAINTLATKMRRSNTAGCNYIEAINNFIA